MPLPIRILIYEDNSDLRGALAALIGGSDGYELTGAFEHCVNIVQEAAVLRPDVVLMDIDLPGISGIEGVLRLKQRYPHIKALMLTIFDDDDRVFEAICASADGYLLKKTPPARILEALREVVDDGAPMSPTIARKVLQAFPSKLAAQDTELDKLTAREVEVLKLLARGFSQKMTAAELGISVETVKTYTKRIYEKLHTHSLAETLARYNVPR